MAGALCLLSLSACQPAPVKRDPVPDAYLVPPALKGETARIVSLVATTRPSLVRIRSEARFFKPVGRYLRGVAKGFGGLLNPHPYWEWPYRVLGFPLYLLFGYIDLSSSVGTGFFVTEDLVLTCAHVIDNADEIRVQLMDGRAAPATLVAENAVKDLALLRVTVENPPAPLRLRSVGYAPGELAIALGFPGRDLVPEGGVVYDEDKMTPNPRVTLGLLSAADVELGNPQTRYLELDAALNPGNSGGPIVGSDGSVLGVATMVSVGKEDEGYAVPSHTVLLTFSAHLSKRAEQNVGSAKHDPGEGSVGQEEEEGAGQEEGR